MDADLLDLPIIDLVSPMPGFPDNRQFVLVRLDENGLLYSLKSVDNADLRFLVMPPAPFFPDYAPEIDDEATEMLGSPKPEDLMVLLVVTAGDSASHATANLLAPIVIDRGNRRGMQTVLSGSGLPVRAELAVAG
ncbi:flagellar assembly factor FliW [Catenuloplanes nepalensis]|uniref:Flagellar assembly factor FliW n=1 Tax=Catenuloplanes nepalensis TaxID=587533 RepID=A0ABT9N3N5_9ACTN|nr:flagellar assembly protein FliW [Catenuloplanes nepalensis]MDP9798031.1 flagellar assembly factor FliW [Catenuloplanes nepalensis]